MSGGWFLVFVLLLILIHRRWCPYRREQHPLGRIRKPALFVLIETILMVIGIWFAAPFILTGSAEDEFALGASALCFGGMLLVEGFFREPSQSESATPGSAPAPPATLGRGAAR